MAYPWNANDILTAADLNAAISTGIVSTGLGAWTSYTPTWTGTIGNGTITGRYIKIGRFFRAKVTITWGSTTSHGAGAQTVSPPFTCVGSEHNGGCRIVDSSAGTQFFRHAFFNSTTAVAFGTEAGVFITGTAPMTWATSDVLHAAFSGETAA